MLSQELPIRTISIMGCGWYGLPLAIRLARSGFQVKGSTTREDKLLKLRKFGIEDYLIEFTPNLKSNQSVEGFFDADVLVLTIPPGIRSGSPASKYLLMLDNLLPHILGSTIRFVIFISATSVYSDLNKIVNENDAGVGDVPENGKALLDAEAKFKARNEFMTTVLRFGGLYGPERNPIKYFAGKTDIKNPDSPTNLVHLEDCIRVTERVIRKKASGHVFNVVCDEHPTRKLYYTEAARILGYAKPLFTSTSEDFPWKIVSNKYLKETLDYQFKFKSPFEGLQN
jgi:nucleoside-diphosphate-sugar epimerase